MSIFWSLIGKPLAAMGGRSFEDMQGRRAGECDKSIAVGVLCLLSVGIIFAGHCLFWRNFDNVADVAVWVAAGIALVFLLMYRMALRAMETMGGPGKLLMLALLASLMGNNAMLAGHELVLLAFAPQVQAQAKLGAARGVTDYAGAVETSLGLPQLRNQSTELDKATAAAQAERGRIPQTVQQLQQQAGTCDASAARLHKAIPADPEQPGHAAAVSALRQQRAQCQQLNRQAAAALAQHQAQLDQQLAGLNQSRSKLRQSLDEANDQHEATLKRDSGTIAASATTGFARHNALWAAVAAGTVPAWGAYGLMAAVLVIDAFSFIFKLVARDDTATTDRIQQAGTDAVYNGLHAALVRQQRSLTRQVVKQMRPQTTEDLANLARSLVLPSVAQGVDERAFSRASAANQRARQAHGAPVPSMLGRLGAMGQAMRRRYPGPAAGAAAGG